MRIKINSPVVLTFSLLCVGIYFLTIATSGLSLSLFTIQPNIHWSNPVELMTLASHILGHISLDHLIGNLTFILLLGPIIEEKYGSQNLLFMIVMTAIITGLINVFFFQTALLGASGIVFMFIILSSFTNVNKGEIPVTFILVTLLFIGKEVISSFESNQISEAAHIIGGICGSIFGFKSTHT